MAGDNFQSHNLPVKSEILTPHDINGVKRKEVFPIDKNGKTSTYLTKFWQDAYQ